MPLSSLQTFRLTPSVSPFWLENSVTFRRPRNSYIELSQLPSLLWLGQLLGLLLRAHEQYSCGEDCLGVLRHTSNLGLSDIFLMITLGLWVSFKFF